LFIFEIYLNVFFLQIKILKWPFILNLVKPST